MARNRAFKPILLSDDSGAERISNLAGNRGDAVSMRDGSRERQTERGRTRGGRHLRPFHEISADPPYSPVLSPAGPSRR